MPQEHKIVNGRLVLTGAQQSSDLVPAVRQQPAKPPAAKPRSKPKPKPKGFFEKLSNDIRYELFERPMRNPLMRYNPLAHVMRLNARGANFVGQQAGLGAVGATDNAARAAYSYVQRASGKPKADPSSGRFGSTLDQATDDLYRLLRAKPPSEMSADERNFDMGRRSLALNVMLAPVTPGFGVARATTALGAAVRGGAAFAVNEALSTYLDDNTGGNIVNLINETTGLKLPGAVDVGKADMLDAANQSLVPNAAFGVGLGAAVGGTVALGAAAFRNIRRNTRATRAVQQETRQRAKQEAMGLLEKDEADGLDFTPQAMEPPAPAPREPSFQEANAAMEQRLGMPSNAARPEPAAAPTNVAPPEPKPIPSAELQDPTNPGADMGAIYEPRQERPWDYDPELPESTALGKGIEELSDSELQIVLNSPGTPVVERVNQTLEARAQVQTPPPMDAGMVMAPADRLADDYLPSVMRKLGGREDYELRPLFDAEANPQLWQKAQALTGVDDPSQLSKADMLDTFGAMAAEGRVPIVNRMMGAQMLPTGEVQAAPLVFQYKGGVNEAGEQIGNSLEGVERWDPNAENIIQVWRDAGGEIGDPGMVYVVNGHNRLAAAKRLGIPSMRVEYLDAPTAAEARLQGAISNVSDGKGTVFDAAKLAREYDIKDPAQLKALGKPGASGFWKDGIAVGRLPEDVFTAAVNEQIPLRRAVIIGESGVDEETMRSAYRYLVQQGPDNVKEGTLREMLAMSKSSPASSSADQPDILSGTEWAQNFNAGMLAKAEVAGAVRLLLSKEKKLFGTVGRQAGQIERVGQVDATAAKDISGEASRALAIFDDLKYQTGPVGDLLNEGTQRVLAGEQAAQVAKGIKNRLAASIQEAMGKEVAPATDVVQEDMFAAAGRQADETSQPVELTAEQRDAAEARLLQEAIAGGEVRPPNAPIPELPAPAQVRLDELDPNEPITPGSRAAQALADETRLALEHARADAALQELQEKAVKDANDYELLTFEEKKELGLTADLGKAITPEVLPAADRPLDELAPAPVRPAPVRLALSASQPELLLPQDLRQASPRYGRNTITFQSDLDRTAYVLANDAIKPSKSAAKFRQVVKEAGLNLDEVVAHGQTVRAALKQAAKGNPGQIELPAQPWRGDGSIDEMSVDGWGSIDTSPFDNLKTRLVRQIAALKIIRQVAGPEVEVRFEDQYLKKIKGPEWGGDGKTMTLQGGFYRLSEDLIMVRGVLQGSEKAVAETAFHESFHRLQFLALGEKEAKVLDGLWSRVKIAIGSDHVTGSPSSGKPIAYAESQAVAFQRYAEARRSGQDPVVALLGGYEPDTPTIQKAIIRIVATFDRVADLVEKLVNRFAIGTFDSTRGVFERARRGALVEQADSAFEEPMSGFEMMTMQNGWRSRSWDLQQIARPTKVSQQRLQRQIDDLDQQIIDNRRKAEQEGC